MTVSSTYSFFFSPTGGTKKIAESFGAIGQCKFVDITSGVDEISLTSDDFAVFSVPSYGGRIPSPVYERLSSIKGNSTPCVVIAVFGNRAVDDAGLEMSSLVTSRGFKVIGYGEFVAPHSVNKNFASDRPDSADMDTIKKFHNSVEEKILTGKLSEPEIPGNPNYREYNGIPLKPQTNKKCISCGKCVSFCPAKAISLSTKAVTDKTACISCMGCIDICPENARYIPAVMKIIASSSLKKLCSGRKEVRFFV